jgi:hypothetical protein
MLFKLLFIAVGLFRVSNAQYIQLSSLVTQPNGALGVGSPLTYNSVDAISSNITFTSGGSKVKIVVPGAYFVIAAIQVGYSGPGTGFFGKLLGNVATFIADYYVAVNGADVSNSNVRLLGTETTKDVIVTQGVYVLAKDDEIEVIGAGTNSISEYIKQAGEPDIPSIITTIYKI